MDAVSLLSVLNSPSSSKEARQAAQTHLFQIQRDPTSWSQVPLWLNDSTNVQLQFFAAQCLLVRINRDWDSLEEEDQMALRQFLAQFLLLPTTRSRIPPPPPLAVIRKLEEAMVQVMQRAFLSGWWKGPLNDLFCIEPVNYRLLAAVPALSSDDPSGNSATYRWHHEIKSHATQLLEVLRRDAHCIEDENCLECLKNWIHFGAITFTQLEPLLPRLFECCLQQEEHHSSDVAFDCLVEICSTSKDQVIEARCARVLIPFVLRYASSFNADLQDSSAIARLAAAIAEECSTYLVDAVHEPEVQMFLSFLIQLTAIPGSPEIDESISPMLLNSWYCLTEAASSAAAAESHAVWVQVFGASLTPILLAKATPPPTSTWNRLPRDIQQQFTQTRREFLDTLIYLHRALKSLHQGNLVLELIARELVSPEVNSTVRIETLLKALIVISEEDSQWNDLWSQLVNFIFSNPAITAEASNAKLAISLIGALIPLMTDVPETGFESGSIDALEPQETHVSQTLRPRNAQVIDDALQLLLSQLFTNPSLHHECVQALQRAADAEIPQLHDPKLIDSLVGNLSAAADCSPLVRLISRLIADLPSEQDRWLHLNKFIGSLSQNVSLASLAIVYRTVPFNFSISSIQVSDAYFTSIHGLLHSNDSLSNEVGEVLLAALNALSAAASESAGAAVCSSPMFSDFESSAILPRILEPQDETRLLGAKLLHSWISIVRIQALPILAQATNLVLFENDLSDDLADDLIEVLLDSWIILIRNASTDITGIARIYQWTLHRIARGSLSVPLLRALTRTICALLEHKQIDDRQPHQLAALVQVSLQVGMNGSLGRAGMEILARALHDLSLLHPDRFRSLLQTQILQAANINDADRKAFLRNIGAAHTIKKFKTALVEFCLHCRGI